MATSYHYASLTKREWFSASAFGGSGDRHGLGRSLTGRAFELLLVRGSRHHSSDDPIEFGRWADDSIAIIGDNDPNWLACFEAFLDLYADLIPVIHRHDGFDDLGEAAAKNDRLYAQICHLIVMRQAVELEGGMKGKFGASYLRRYKDVLPRLQRFQQPRDLSGRRADEPGR